MIWKILWDKRLKEIYQNINVDFLYKGNFFYYFFGLLYSYYYVYIPFLVRKQPIKDKMIWASFSCRRIGS